VNRRTFIKGLLGAATVVALPIKALAEKEVLVKLGTTTPTLDNLGIAAERVAEKIRELAASANDASMQVRRLSDCVFAMEWVNSLET
jgi:hypothetical protein